MRARSFACCPCLMVHAFAAIAGANASAATLYTCVDARGIVRYSGEPCVQGQPPMAIDRLDTDERALARNARDPEGAATDRAAARPALTPEQARNIARLRATEQGLTREARVATEIEIAAVREGVEGLLTAGDTASIDALRAELASADAATRERALRRWQAIYAQYRLAPRPSAHPAPMAAPPPRDVDIRGPLGRPAPGTQGPLGVAPPAPPPLAPATRPSIVADPATGRVFAPAGDRLVDPITGTLWQRAGSVYVDPITGRVIPAP